MNLGDSSRSGKTRDWIVDFYDNVVAVVVHGLDERGQSAFINAALLSVGQVAALDLCCLQIKQFHLILSLLLIKGIVENGRRVDRFRQGFLLPDGL